MLAKNGCSLGLCLVVLALIASDVAGETVSIPGPKGEIATQITLPPDFDPEASYPVLAAPGDFYWQDRPSQPGWIVVSSDGFWGEGRLENSGVVLDWIEKNYRVSRQRFHLAGWSANSAGVFEIAMTYPERIASVTGIAGMPGAGSERSLQKLRGVRVQFIVGEHDSYWRNGSESWHAKLEAAGVESSLEIIADGEHVMPEIANEPLFERLNGLLQSMSTP